MQILRNWFSIITAGISNVMMGSNFGIPKKDSYVRERFYSLLAIDIKSSVLVELTEVLP